MNDSNTQTWCIDATRPDGSKTAVLICGEREAVKSKMDTAIAEGKIATYFLEATCIEESSAN